MQKLNVTDGQTDGRGGGGVAISPVKGLRPFLYFCKKLPKEGTNELSKD